MPRYMIPEEIEFCENLPKTSTGKIDRKLLEAVSNPPNRWREPFA